MILTILQALGRELEKIPEEEWKKERIQEEILKFLKTPSNMIVIDGYKFIYED